MAKSTRVQTRKIEHVPYGSTGIPMWAVTFTVVDTSGYDALFTIHVLGLPERDIASVDAEARKELHRISSALAGEGPAPEPETPEPEAPALGGRRRGRTFSEMGRDQDARKPEL